MANLNKDLEEAAGLKRKILSDLEKLTGICSKVSKEVNSRLHLEMSQNGSSEGLEDFAMLNQIVKKNAMMVKNAHTLLNRMRTTEGYSVSEEKIPDEKALEELFDK